MTNITEAREIYAGIDTHAAEAAEPKTGDGNVEVRGALRGQPNPGVLEQNKPAQPEPRRRPSRELRVTPDRAGPQE